MTPVPSPSISSLSLSPSVSLSAAGSGHTNCGDGGIQTRGWQRWLDPDGAGIAAREALAGGSKRGLLDPGGAGGWIRA
jgi:hypothetical protein